MLPLLNKLKEKIRTSVPGVKAIERKTKAEEARGKYYEDVHKAVKFLRTRKSTLPAGLEKKSPEEYNEIMKKFNADTNVRSAQDKVRSYKLKQKLSK